MSERVDHTDTFAAAELPSSGSPAATNVGPSPSADRANEQSQAGASTDKVLALFLWRCLWRDAFARAFSTCAALAEHHATRNTRPSGLHWYQRD